MVALNVPLPPHTHTHIHAQHPCADQGFFYYYYSPPPSSSSPHFTCRANEAADSTLYWHSAKISLAPSISFCSPYWSPPTSLQATAILSLVLPGIQRWHKWNAQLFITGTQSHITRGEPRTGEKEEEEEKEKIQNQKNRRQETLMRRDSLTELGHAYWKQSSNAKRHPPKPSRKPWTRGKGEPQRHWKGAKWCGEGDYGIKTKMIYFCEFKNEMTNLKMWNWVIWNLAMKKKRLNRLRCSRLGITSANSTELETSRSHLWWCCLLKRNYLMEILIK